MLRLSTLLLILAAAAVAQTTIRIGTTPRFIDFSDDLHRPKVAVVLGTLDKTHDGKRRRIRDEEAHVGIGGAIARFSGTQYYEVAVQGTLAVEGTWAGAKAGKSLPLEFDIRLSRLPDGRELRELRRDGGTTVRPTMRGLWVVEKSKRGWRLLHVLSRAAEDPRSQAAFEDDLRDLVDLNQRIATLKDAVEAAKAVGDKSPEKAIALLNAALEPALELRNPTNDALGKTHVAPWERRAREMIEKLRGGL